MAKTKSKPSDPVLSPNAPQPRDTSGDSTQSAPWTPAHGEQVNYFNNQRVRAEVARIAFVYPCVPPTLPPTADLIVLSHPDHDCETANMGAFTVARAVQCWPTSEGRIGEFCCPRGA